MRHSLGLAAAALLLGGISGCVCTTAAAPPPAGAAPVAVVEPGATEVYYDEPVAPPPAEWADNVVWFYGPHPVSPGWGAGWCPIAGPHTHPYEPAFDYVYYFYGGYYYYGGDPAPYGVTTYYVYGGPHPNPWGGWCYIQHRHQHFYAPRRAPGIHFSAGVYLYDGPYDAEYQREHVYYDNDGRRAYYEENGHRVQATGYRDHVEYRTAHFGGPPHLEPMHGLEPAHGGMEPAHGLEPAHGEPPHDGMEPAHGEPAHGGLEPARGEPAHGGMEPARGEPAHVEPAHGQPAHVEPVKGGGKPEPVKKEDKGKKKK